jgi:hypothetical protein
MKDPTATTVPRALCVLFTLASAACSSSTATPGSGGAPVDSGKDDAEGGPQDSGTGEGQPGAVDTWSSYAQGFFQTFCVECHGASDPTGRDFTQYSVVKSNAPTIRCGVCVMQAASWACPASPVARQFPIDDSTHSNPKPTDAERNRIVAWIGAGAPQ